jgi:succinate dehydrogenase/fumarate reductase flavoprotein subunit
MCAAAKLNVMETDVLVVGGGIAGAFAAIKAKEANVEKVTLITKGMLGKDSISAFAAGVWIAFLPEDDKDVLLRDFALSDVHGGGLYDEDWLNVFLNENYDRLVEVDRWGVEWEKTPDGKYERKECRWKLKQCMFHGPQLMEAVAKKVVHSGVKVVPHTMVTDILTLDGNPPGIVVGAVGFDVRSGAFQVFKSKCTVMAAGGCGYKARFACHKMDTGDAVAIAYRAGAILGRFDEGKLHTTCAEFDIQGLNMFVGLGGKFVNAQGERFMLEYAPELGDHSGMTTLSEASAMEVRAGRGPIYLDMTHFTPDDVKKLRAVLPIPTRILERTGVIVGDKIVRKMEWAPAYYGTIGMSGGIVANTKCETSLAGLYACGDSMARAKPTAALPMAAVSGARAGRFAAEFAKEMYFRELKSKQVESLRRFAYAALKRKDGIESDHIIIGIHEALLPYEVTVIAREETLLTALRKIERIRDEEVPLLYATDAHYLRLANETRNMVCAAEMYLRSRLLRRESRDSSLREDYPHTDNIEWLKTILLRQEQGRMKLWTEDVPAEKYKYKPKREKYLYPVFEVARRRGVKWG